MTLPETIYQKRALIYVPSDQWEAANRAINGTTDKVENPDVGTDNFGAKMRTRSDGRRSGYMCSWQMTPEEFTRYQAMLSAIPGVRFMALEHWDPQRCTPWEVKTPDLRTDETEAESREADPTREPRAPRTR